MDKKALGFIETVGMAAAVEAADTSLKTADVKLIGYELTKGGGMVTVKIEGDVSAVKAALQSAWAGASKVNKVYTSLVIPRPSQGIEIFVNSDSTVGLERHIPPGSESKRDHYENKAGEEDSKTEIEDNKDLPETSEEVIYHKKENTAASELQDTENHAKEENCVPQNMDEKAEYIREDEVGIQNEKDREHIEENGGFSDEQVEIGASVSPELIEVNKEYVCNICHDPLCSRHKGQPRTMCIHNSKNVEVKGVGE
jgi:ethanolamine utilization protein EutM